MKDEVVRMTPEERDARFRKCGARLQSVEELATLVVIGSITCIEIDRVLGVSDSKAVPDAIEHASLAIQGYIDAKHPEVKVG